MRVNPAPRTRETLTAGMNAQLPTTEVSDSMKSEQRRRFLPAVFTLGFLWTDISPISYFLEWIDSIPWIVT